MADLAPGVFIQLTLLNGDFFSGLVRKVLVKTDGVPVEIQLSGPTGDDGRRIPWTSVAYYTIEGDLNGP